MLYNNNNESQFLVDSDAFRAALNSPRAKEILLDTSSPSTQRLWALLAVDYSTNHRPCSKTQSWMAKCLGVCVRTIRRGISYLQKLNLITVLRGTKRRIGPNNIKTTPGCIFMRNPEQLSYNAKGSLFAFHVLLNKRDLLVFNKSGKKLSEGDEEAAREAFIWEYIRLKESKHGKKFQSYLINLRQQLLMHARFPEIKRLLAYCEAAYANLVQKLGRYDVAIVDKFYRKTPEERQRRKQHKSYVGERYGADGWQPPVMREYVEAPKGPRAEKMPDWLKEKFKKILPGYRG